ncbi:GntR family transcriptional regulator [Deinococcus budaensis]|uniref:HTH gntR-type domain-containing protein n=1 Tax=Deinococcus budaensis TaxID=1665626 RepID=A0A7W8GGG2_9DEIO|nr:GntR family transcriptional regulator [Deinococcus budaensis]MBB5234773.1 hypothetical protein [Deinococcus budaensis]
MTRGLNVVTLRGVLGQWSAGGPACRDLAAPRQSILGGRLPLETRLPGERELAAALGVSRTTVTAAYTESARRQVSGHPARGARHPGPAPGSRRAEPALQGRADLWRITRPAPRPGLRPAARARECAAPGVHGRAPGAAHASPTHGYGPLGLPALRAAIDRRRARLPGPACGCSRRRCRTSRCFILQPPPPRPAQRGNLVGAGREDGPILPERTPFAVPRGTAASRSIPCAPTSGPGC